MSRAAGSHLAIGAAVGSAKEKSGGLTAFGTEPGAQVVIERLSAVLEANLDPTNRRFLTEGELRATMQ